jgi:peptidoglycan hydrolase CwlO-like protein
MKESFEHDTNRNFDWKENTPLDEKDKIVNHIEGDGFYSIKADESVKDSNTADNALRNSRMFLTEEDTNAVKQQLEAHKMHFKDEYDEFVKNDEELTEIKKELHRMNLTIESFDKDIEFTDPVARDQFEEMAQTYRHLAQRNIEIQDKIKTLINTLN